MDNHATGLLGRLDDFVRWWKSNVPKKRDDVIAVIKAMIGTQLTMPEPFWSGRFKRWSELLEYFNGVLHHNTRADHTDFMQKLEMLEVFLLEHLEPKTFDDQDEIDALIAAGEGAL